MLKIVGLFLILLPTLVSAQSVEILKAKFDGSGRLVVTVEGPGSASCYLTVLGGLSRTTTDTAIVSARVNASGVEAGRQTIRTVKKFYCKKRTLYVTVQRICVDETPPGSSRAVKVVVPSSNVR